MKCHAFLGDILSVEAASRILVWNCEQTWPGGTMERLGRQNRLTFTYDSRLRWMAPATVLVSQTPKEPTSYVLVKDDSKVPFRQLLSSGLMAAGLTGSKTAAVDVHRSERRFPHVETTLEHVVDEIRRGIGLFTVALDALSCPSFELATLLLVSHDEAVFEGLRQVFP